MQSVTHTGAVTGTDSYEHDAAGDTTARPGQTLTHDATGKLSSVAAAATTHVTATVSFSNAEMYGAFKNSDSVVGSQIPWRFDPDGKTASINY